MTTTESFDVVVIGGGIIGSAVAREFTRRAPGTSVVVFEKETSLASHQSGRNSGVIHSGIFYRPDSRKAALCVTGAADLKEYIRAHGLPIRTVGKLIVAARDSELRRLTELEAWGRRNRVGRVERLTGRPIREVEPRAGGVAALHLPEVAITDFQAVSRSFAGDVEAAHGVIRTGEPVLRLERGGKVRIVTTKRCLDAKLVVNCAGLFSDLLAREAGAALTGGIVPMWGEYRRLAGPLASSIRGLIYPVPNPRVPFLGMHVVVRLDGSVEIGPTATWAWKREAYLPGPFSLRDRWEALSSSGALPMILRFGRFGTLEWARSVNREWLAASLRELLPELSSVDLSRGRVGIRAQAVDSSGHLLDDFQFAESRGCLHVLNAPSPAATACLAIAREVVDRATGFDRRPTRGPPGS